MTKLGQSQSKVAKVSQKWPKVTKGGPRGPKVAKSGKREFCDRRTDRVTDLIEFPIVGLLKFFKDI